jgi:hypothetical protein
MRQALVILAAYGALASYLAAAEPSSRHTAIDTREAMVSGINSAAVAIWDISSEARGEEGELDPSRMTDDSWSQLRDEAQALESWARMMAEADTIHAAGPDLASREVPAGVASRAEIQAMIDANPEVFRASARDLAERANLLVAAAGARDAVAAGHRAAEIDVPCQGCHTRYWYKQDKPQVEEQRPRA